MLSEDDEFRMALEFPMWTLAYADALDEHGLPGSLVILTDQTDGTQSVSLFSDEDLAERFVTEGAIPGNIALVRVESPASLHEWLPDLAKHGVTHVGLDTAGRPNQRAWRVTIASFLSRLPADPNSPRS